MLFVRNFQHFDDAWHTHRAAPDHAVIKRHRLAISADKQFVIYTRGCGFAAVKSLYLVA